MDLLRIVAMFLIVFLHSIDHSGVLENAENCDIGMYFYVSFTYCICQVCVNIFILLSGYYLVSSKFHVKKILSLWLDTVFYGFLLKLLFCLVGNEQISMISLASCFFPIATGRYWFVTIYVGMYLVSPYLNTLIHAMDKKQHGTLNVLLFAVMSLWVSIHPAIAGMNAGGGWGLAWFIVLYLAAAWFRQYYTPSHKPGKWMLGVIAIPLCISFAQCVLRANGCAGIVHDIIMNWYRYDSAPVYLISICLFLTFLNVQLFNPLLGRTVCLVAPLTFAVYLIHAHANVSPWIWETLALPDKMSSYMFPVIQLSCVVGIMLICMGLDLVKKLTFDKLIAKFIR